MNLNKAIVIGSLTQDPELRYGANGTPVCSFTVATNSYWQDASGNRQQETEFHRCVAFGDLGERIAAFMTKGSHLCVEGRLKTEAWDHGVHKHYRFVPGRVSALDRYRRQRGRGLRRASHAGAGHRGQGLSDGRAHGTSGGTRSAL